MRTFVCTLAALWLAATPAIAEQKPFQKGTFAAIQSAHAGKPYIVHVWGLSCGPCLAELPEWGRLAAGRPGLPLVLINADRPGSQDQRRMDDVLARAGLATAETYVFADRFEERLRFEIDQDWQGELPRSILISATGEATAVPGVADMATVKAWVERNPK